MTSRNLPNGVTQKMIDDYIQPNEPDVSEDTLNADHTDQLNEKIEGEAYIYKTDGTVEYRKYTAAPSLKGLQEAVGGYLETVPYFSTHKGMKCVAFCNEEGKLNKLPLNITATKLWYGEMGTRYHLISDVLVGDVIVLMGNRAFMEAL